MAFSGVQLSLALRPRRGEPIAPEDVVLLVVWVVLLMVWGSFAFRQRHVVLASDGIKRRGLLGSVFIPWEAVAAGQQATVWNLGARWLHLAVSPGGVRRKGFVLWADELPLQELDVDTRFLSDAIEFYVRHPERRTGIGTPEEHRRLYADLASWYSAGRADLSPAQ
jgi:hypothetical protein